MAPYLRSSSVEYSVYRDGEPVPLRRVRDLLYWIAPWLFCVLLYRAGLRAWFQQDDFAWLGLSRSVHDPASLAKALFAPLAQGTFRPLSERALFLVFHGLFGLDAQPYRAWVFLTQFANLALLSSIARRLTGSRLAGFLAPVLWVANSTLVVAMCWASAYNQVLCGFFLLLAFHCFLRYTETGQTRYLAGQWIAFALGLGALELMAIYPALPAVYALCRDRKYLRQTWPMFLVSAAFALAHYYWLAPVRAGVHVYELHFGASMLPALWTFWQWALGPSRLARYAVVPAWVAPLGTALLTLSLGAFVVWSARRRQWLVLLPVAWFAALLLPVLPLRYHHEEYYLTLPTAGLALLGAWALSFALRRTWIWRIAGLVLLGVYLYPNLIEARLASRIVARRSRNVRTLVLGVLRVRQLHPSQTILLTGIGSELFWTGVFPKPFRALGISGVYLAPETEAAILPRPELGQVSDYVMPPRVLLDAMAQRQVLVYTVEPDRLRAVTLSYYAQPRHWKTEEPRQVDVGSPSFARQLGPSWYELDSGHRWMPRRATVRLAGPRTAAGKLQVSGWCPAAQVASGPLKVRFSVDGERLPEVTLLKGDAVFNLVLPLPPGSLGKPSLEITVEVDRTFSPPPDERQLGLVFGIFEIRE